MTDGATPARLWLRNAQRFSDPGRTRIQKNCVGAGMKIFLRPGDELAAFFAGAAVAAGRFATHGPDELRFGGLCRLFGGNNSERNR